MEIAPDLARWLGDRPGRARLRAAAAAFARDWPRDTPLPALRAALADVDERDAEAVAALVRPLLEEIGWAERLVARLAGEIAAAPFFDPPFIATQSAVQRGLVLLDHPLLGISLAVGPLEALAARKRDGGGPRAISFPGYLSLVRVIADGGATLGFWEAEAAGADFGGEGRCRYAGRRRIRRGEIFIVDGRRQSFVVEHAGGDLLLLQASIRAGAAPYLVDYDSVDGRCLGVAATDERASRAQFLASLLGALGRRDAGPALAALATSDHGFLRWHGLREWAALDHRAARPAIERAAAADPRADVRAAASATLALLDARAKRETPCPA